MTESSYLPQSRDSVGFMSALLNTFAYYLRKVADTCGLYKALDVICVWATLISIVTPLPKFHPD